MSNGLFTGLFALPFLASALIALFLRRASSSTVRYVALAVIASTALCALLLLPSIGNGPTIVIEWIPGTGPMTLGLGATGLYAALVTSIAAFLITLGVTPYQVERPALSASVVLLALSATNAAFLAKHFLARYVALEIAALCIALAPLIELKGPKGGRTFWLIYLVLRLGDVGLLSAILILADASGTLEIAPALEVGATLDSARLGWAVAGLILAVWVKMGGWPFHLWSRLGRTLSLNTQAWLYAIVAPNLGAYLLYRVTSLLTLHGPLQTVALWLGAAGAALAALITLTHRDSRDALVYVGAAQAGLLLFTAACGLKKVVWLGLLVTTLLRALLFLAGNARQQNSPLPWRRAAAGVFALGGLGLTGFGLLITWWSRMNGAPLGALFVAESAVALTGVWTVREAYGLTGRKWRGQETDRGSLAPPSPGQGIAVGVLGLVVLVGGLGFAPLARYLATSVSAHLPKMPSLFRLLRYVVTTPALLLISGLTLAVWALRKYSGVKFLAPFLTDQAETTYDWEKGLSRVARALHAIVEAGILERIVSLSVQGVSKVARTLHTIIEVGVLERIVSLSVRGVVEGARVAYHFVEQEGLEGLLRRIVRTIMALNKMLKRWHTGLVRRNLLWIPISLALAILVALLY